jgi:hypothetical protein
MQIVGLEYDVKLRVTVRGTRRDLRDSSIAQDIAISRRSRSSTVCALSEPLTLKP